MRRIRKKITSVLLSVVMGLTILPTTAFASDNKQDTEEVIEEMTEEAEMVEEVTEAEVEETEAVEVEAPASSQNKVTINLWSFTDEMELIVQKYIETHPNCGIEINSTIIETTDDGYQPALDQALMRGGANAPDIYAVEDAFVLKYTQGEASAYAGAYKDLGIDVDAKIKEADIAQYSVDIGTNKNGDVVGLGYQSTSGAFVYRRSIAKKVWGTDDPATIAKKIGGGTGNLDAFWTAAADLKAKGYSIISGENDLWHAVENSADQGWIVDGALNIDPKREVFLDYSKKLKTSGYTNDTKEWQDGWFDDMKGTGKRPVFGYFGPAWLINYTIAPNCGGSVVGAGTYGDWAVCESPMGFYWGGTWILTNKDISEEKKSAIKDIVEWITLDCTDEGLQYMWANGTLYGEGGTKDSVASGTVMAMANGELDFLGGQDMYDIFVKANKSAKGTIGCPYEETINSAWKYAVSEYADGSITRQRAIDDFKSMVNDILNLGDGTNDPYDPQYPIVPDDSNVIVINLWSFTDEVPMMVNQYIAEHPNCGFRINPVIVSATDGSYQPALDRALMKGGADAPDIYTAEVEFVLKYSQGEAAAYAATYKQLGIDVDAKIKKADIAKYSVELGTNPKGDVVGLGYQATGGAFIYRRSIAKATWGTDDPAVVAKKIGGGTGNLDAFWTAAADLKKKGYAIISGADDLWRPIENSAYDGWIVDGALSIDPKRELFLDYSKKLRDGGYTNNTMLWQEAWFKDMNGSGSKGVLGYFGPAWLINYTLAPNCGGDVVGEGTYGDWAVCEAPIGFYWGGTWIFANKNLSAKKVDAVKTIIEWITLDCTKDGLQYKWANGTLYGAGGTKDCVASGTVMAMSDGRVDFLGGQNMFDVYIKANHAAKGSNATLYDETIDYAWQDQARQYARGYKSKAAALADFRAEVDDIFWLTGFAQKPSSWYKQNGKWYYYDSKCVMVTGWKQISGKWYYFGNDGVMVSGWKKISGVWYYFDGGVMVSGWKKIGNVWYYFDDGAMVSGWKKISNKWYYFDDGAMVSGWKKISNKWYYFDGGAMVTGWKKISNKWYYFETSGIMAASKWISDTYYVKSDGTMAMNEWVGKYYVDANGKYVPGKTR